MSEKEKVESEVEKTELVVEPLTTEDLEDVSGGAVVAGGCTDGGGCNDGGGCDNGGV